MTLTNDQVLDLCRRRNAGIIAASAATNPHAAALADSRSKTNQEGSQPELVVLPRAKATSRCPVELIQAWVGLAGITEGPLFWAITPAETGCERRPDR